MATPREQHVFSSSQDAVEFKTTDAASSTVVSVALDVANAPIVSSVPTSNHLRYSVNSIINRRNTFIALLVMILLLIAQTHISDRRADTITTLQALAPAANKPLMPAQVPVVATPAAVKPPVNKKPANIVAKPRPVPVVVALAPEPDPVAPVVVEEIKADAVTSLAETTGSGFVKIAYTGEALEDMAESWECVEDKNNKLTWEVKKNDGGIRDNDHSYSWLSRINGKNVSGVRDGGRCNGGVNCDTSSYTRAMNKQKLCGYSDWRLPTKAELETLVEYNNNSAMATINKQYFPQAVPSWYWTASENGSREDLAWYVLFRNGVALNDLKERPKHIRLVRGNPAKEQ